jgi:hypothetical protein
LNDLLDLSVYVAYIEKLVTNDKIKRYLKENHSTLLSRIEHLLSQIANPGLDSEEDAVTVWSVKTAKERLPELMMECHKHGPQLIRRSSEPGVIVISTRRWRAALRRYPKLEEFVFQAKVTDHPNRSATHRSPPRAAKKAEISAGKGHRRRIHTKKPA